MSRLTFAALLSVVAVVLLFGTDYALLASAAALSALALSWTKDLDKEPDNEHRSYQRSADRAHHP